VTLADETPVEEKNEVEEATPVDTEPVENEPPVVTKEELTEVEVSEPKIPKRGFFFRRKTPPTEEEETSGDEDDKPFRKRKKRGNKKSKKKTQEVDSVVLEEKRDESTERFEKTETLALNNTTTAEDNTVVVSSESTLNTTTAEEDTEVVPSERNETDIVQSSATAEEHAANQKALTLSKFQSGMVITGYPQGIIPPGGIPPGPPPYRYYRRSGVPPPGSLPQQPMNMPQNSILIAEVLVSILGTLSRLWFLTWLTKRIASQEESIQPTQHFVWERLNDRYLRDSAALKTALQVPPEGVSTSRWNHQHMRKTRANVKPEKVDFSKVYTRTVVVVELSDNPKEGITYEQMAEVVTFLLQQHKERAFGTHKKTGEPMDLEVVFLVQSPGGSVATFGLAASQMGRLSQVAGLTTTVCVDRYAASGGYMIASQAHKLLAAPFATLGSIGVIMEGLNFHELAQRYGVQPLVIKAGASKNRLSQFGPVSSQDIHHEEAKLAKVHEAFQQLVVKGRPALAESLALVADGSVFLGQEAMDLQMVDGVMTSDEYIQERVFARDRVLRLHRSYQARMPRRLSLSPLDLLPHLKSLLPQLKSWLAQDGKQVLFCRLVQATGALGLVQQSGALGMVQQLLQSFGDSAK
jgi:ClpP class serine protease